MTPLIPIEKSEFETAPGLTYALLKSIPKFFIALASIIASLYSYHQLAILSFPFILSAIYDVLHLRSIHYYLTKQQIIIRKGIFTKTTHYLELYRIKDISATEPFFLGIMGMMNVDLITFDYNEPNLLLKGIPISSLPQDIRNLVQNCRQQNKILTVDR